MSCLSCLLLYHLMSRYVELFVVVVSLSYYQASVENPYPEITVNERKISQPCADPEGGQGVLIPLKNHKSKGFPSNTSQDPLKITKLASQHSMFGHHRPANEMPFQWRFAGGQVMARFSSFLSLSPLKNKKQTKKKHYHTKLRQNFLDPRKRNNRK